MTTDLHQTWLPVAASDDLTPRHVFQGKLLGREMFGLIWVGENASGDNRGSNTARR